MPDLPFRETTLTDAQGNPHRYRLQLLSYSEALKLRLELMEIVGKTLGTAVSSIESLADLQLDFERLGEALAKLPGEILAKGGPDFYARLLRGCSRERHVKEGKRLVPRYEKLDTEGALGRAFRGNFVEQDKAVWWVIKENYGPFSLENTGPWGELLAPLRPLIQPFTELLAPIPQTSPPSDAVEPAA